MAAMAAMAATDAEKGALDGMEDMAARDGREKMTVSVSDGIAM